MEVIEYTPPPTVKHFIMDYRPGELFYDWIVGPVGSGKTVGNFMKLVYMAGLQEPQEDGIRRSRAVVVRSTAPQLRDTTIKSWDGWFKEGQAGSWALTDKTFTLRFGDVECEVLFRPLDTPQDVSRVLSLEITFAIIDEFVDIPQQIIDALSGRLGRYPAVRDGGATNWGMWGASNPSTEDNWWFDHLHNADVVQPFKFFGPPDTVAANVRKLKDREHGSNVRYFLQPSGQGDYAENIANLPGGKGYYENQAIGKKPAWIKQFLDAEWGFSASDTPVIGTFQPTIHIAKTAMHYNPHLPLVIGFDPGLGGTAAVLGQEDLYGRLLVLGEVGAVGMGATRFITERLKPYLRRRFPDAQVIVAPDPASINRGQTNEVAVVQVIKKHFVVSIESNNHLAKRIDAIENYTTRITEVGPALLLDFEHVPNVKRALAGGWKFGMVPKGDTQKPQPEKNSYSHYGDAFGYLARYFHKQFEKGGVRGVTTAGRQANRQYAPSAAPRYNYG